MTEQTRNVAARAAHCMKAVACNPHHHTVAGHAMEFAGAGLALCNGGLVAEVLLFSGACVLFLITTFGGSNG